MEPPNGDLGDVATLNGSAHRSSDKEAEAPPLRLRLLCPHSLVPALIGKKGENIKRIRRESGAAVSVADVVVGCDERVVHITGESVDSEDSSSAADALCGVFDSICTLQARRAEAPAAGPAAGAAPAPPPPPPSSSGDGGRKAEAAAAAGSNGSAKAADGEATNGGLAAADRPGAATAEEAQQQAAAQQQQQQQQQARMLVDSGMVGFLVGRGGATIKDTMARSGASVRILPKPELPACAALSDEVVRVGGSMDAVLSALRLLAQQIKAHPQRHHYIGGGGGGGGPPHGAARAAHGGVAGPGPHGGGHLPQLMIAQGPHPDLAYMHPHHQHPAAAGGFFPPGAPPGMMPAFSGTAVEVTFRLMAPVARTGNIIGKGGEHVRRVRSETGARIKVFDPAPGSEERVVALTSSEDALSAYCAAQDALIRCVIALTADDAPNATHRVRLLTAQASVGMVLGKRGATVSQLRQETGASIKVLPVEPVPPAFGGGLGSDDADDLGSTSSGGGGGSASSATAEEIIQVEGGVQQCVAALRGVATLLRGWQIRRLLALQMAQQQQQQQQFGGMAAVAAMHMQHQHSVPQPIPVSPTASSLMSPSSPGIMGLHLPSTLSSPVQPGYLVMNGMQQQAQQSPPWAHQQAPQGPPQQAQRSVQYVYHLSNAQVGAVLGKGGAHISQIRSMSGARVQLQGEIEGGRILLVAGLPDQCHAAHGMTNAFLSMGRCEPAYPEPSG